MPSRITTRAGIQWNDNIICEPTSTIVSTVNEHYVDIRCLEDHTTSLIPGFPFDWVFFGRIVEGEFIHEVDSRYIDALVSSPEQAEIYLLPDVADHVENEPNGDEIETGKMLNPKSKKIEKFKEIWRPIEPWKGPELTSSQTPQYNNKHSVVLEVDDDNFKGKIIKVGNWSQGVLLEKSKKGIESISVVRAYEKKILITWGLLVDSFPLDEILEKIPHEFILKNGVKWKLLVGSSSEGC